MDGHGHAHAFSQSTAGYAVDNNELLNGDRWNEVQGQYAFQQQDPVQAQYPQYAITQQPSFDHFDLNQQQSYAQDPYTQSPYTSQFRHQNQHQHPQHARPQDVFSSSAYSFDSHTPTSLQNSNPYPPQHNAFDYGQSGPSGGTNAATITPQALHYSGNGSINQPQQINGLSHEAYQRLSNRIDSPNQLYNNQFNQRPAQEPTARYYTNSPKPPVQQRPAEQRPIEQRPVANPILPVTPAPAQPVQAIPSPAPTVIENNSRSSAPPQSRQKQADPLRIIHPELLAKAKNSPNQTLKLAPFLILRDESIQIPPGLKNTIPKYKPRKSRSGKDLLAGVDISTTTTKSRVSTTTTPKIKPPRKKVHVSLYKGTSQGARQTLPAVTKLRRDDGTLSPSVRSPSAPVESSSSEESSSEEESEYEEDDIMVQVIEDVRGPTRPADAAAAAGWDAIGIIWKDPGSNPSVDVIKESIQKYGDFVIGLRGQLKSNSEEMKTAESQPAELARLKKARQILLDSLFETIDAANRLGYGGIVENLGGHQRLVNGLVTTLIDCNSQRDFLGKLPRAVFSLLAKFQTMSDDLLKKVRFDNIQKRWNKKADDEIKKYITAILANTTDAREKANKEKKDNAKLEDKKKPLGSSDQAKAQNPITSKPTSSSTKRPFDGDGSNGQPSKRVASDGASAATSKILPLKRPTNLLAGLMGAPKPAPKPAPKKREPSPPRPSMLAGILEQIEKPKEPPKAPSPPPGPPETPEEKKRRERKESRRHLRVKFKEGSDLEEVRLFKHEQAEDEGRQDAMLKDMNDAHSEGMMLKKRSAEDMDVDGNMEDEDQAAFETSYRPYRTLEKIDFSAIDKSVMAKNFVTRAGSRTFTTPEQAAQDRREGLELLVVYTDPKDIPPSPKEPHPSVDAASHFKQFGKPSEPWLLQRVQEVQQYGPKYATQISIGRLGERKAQEALSSTKTAPRNQGAPEKPRIMSPEETAMWANLERIVLQCRDNPYPPTEPPVWMCERDKVLWWEGYNRDLAAKAQKEADQRMAQAQAARAQVAPAMIPAQYQMPAHQMSAYAPQASQPSMSYSTSTPDINQQVSSLLANLSGTQNDSHIGGQHGGNSMSSRFDHNSWAKHNENNNGEGRPQGFGTQRSKWENTMYDEPDTSNLNHRPKDRGFDMKQWDGSAGSPSVPENYAAVQEYKGKKKQCKFFMEGKCAKNAKCTFLHE